MGKDVLSRYDTTYTQNREISWLRFNRRVLEEAADDRVPLLERLKFISIFTSNLDEFFMVRVGSLFDLSLMSPKEQDNRTGETASQQLNAIFEVIPGLVQMKNSIFQTVTAELAAKGICDLSDNLSDAEEKKYVSQYFKNFIQPVLSAQVIDAHHPFPHLVNKALYVAVLLRDKKGRASLGLIPVPESVPAYVILPNNNGLTHYVRTERIIQQNAARLFAPYKVEESCVLAITRNADVRFDEEKFEDSDIDYRNRISKLIKKRSNLSIVRLEISQHIGVEFMKMLKARINVSDKQIYVDAAPLDMHYVYPLCGKIDQALAKELSFEPYQSRWPEDLSPERSMIEQIKKRDHLLSFPFDRIDPFLRLLSEAAENPNVVSIKITIYRLASTSRIAQILCRAAENGKEVTALMELLARFDEENNISWSQMLEDAGCHVIYGIENFKCHSKICLITMQNGEQVEYITQIGTGNYNEKTSALYTDLSLMTAAQDIGQDASVFFQNMLLGNLADTYDHLLVAPNGLKNKLLQYMDREIAKGSEGFICIKANSLTDRQIIDKLSEASGAGVRIELILRGICCLKPGIPGKTDNVHVTSIVGRYLEHSRIYRFGRDEDLKLFIASADMMTRNLNRRVEIAVPIRDEAIKQKILSMLDILLKDNVKASTMREDGTYLRKLPSNNPVCSQEYFMEHSLHTEAELLADHFEEPKVGFFTRLKAMFKRK